MASVSQPIRRVQVALAVMAALALLAPAGVAGGQEWPDFLGGGDLPRHSPVALEQAGLAPLWTFSLGQHTWEYRKGMSLMSPPVVGRANGRDLVFFGAYDRNVYALDAKTGEPAWRRFTAGDGVYSAPALVHLALQDQLIVASADRCVYGLDAGTGKPLWTRELLQWSVTTGPAAMSSVVAGRVGDEYLAFLGAQLNDTSVARPINEGLVLAIRLADQSQPDRGGEIVWKRRLSSAPVSTPALIDGPGRPRLIAVAGDGIVCCLDPATGDELWRYVYGEEIYSSPAVIRLRDRTLAVLGTRMGTVIAIDVATGQRAWSYKAGWWVDATAAACTVDGRTLAIVGSNDRRVHAIDAATGEGVWTYEAGNAVYGSPAIAYIQDSSRPVVVTMAWDDRVYLLDARDGRPVWQFQTGPFPWSHIQRGESLWGSPAVGLAYGRGMVFIPAHDGVFYAFGAGPAAPSAEPTPPLTVAMMMGGVLLFVAANFALVLALGRWRRSHNRA